MKRIYTYLLMAASLTAASCSESWLNLNPSTSVTTDQALSTLTDIQTALYGVYRQTSQHSYYGDNYWYYADCRGMDVQARESKGDGRRVSPYYEYNVTATDNLNESARLAQSRGLTTHLKSIREMFRLRFNPLFAPPFGGGEQCST